MKLTGKGNREKKTAVSIAFCLLPALAVYTGIVIYPIIKAVWYSFYNWSGGPVMKYIGLRNYQMLFRDSGFWNSCVNNIIITALCVAGQIGIAFVLSVLLQARFVKFKSFHRVVSFFPSTVSAVIAGFVWMFIFNYDYGLINSFLRLIGKADWARAWLDNPRTIIFVVSIPLIWQFIGYYMAIIISAMTSIDRSIYEVAELDGASGFERAVYITFPLIRNSLVVAVMLCIAGNMKIFDHIYVMTNGGPGTSSTVMALLVYKTTFIKNHYGYANAMSVMIMLLSGVLILAVKLLGRLISGRDDAAEG